MRNHSKGIACFMFALWVMGICASMAFSYSSGPPDGRTGSPDDNFKTCKDTGCHNSYELNSGEATLSISAPSSYTLNEALDITVSFGNSNTPKHGFELSALDADNNHAGTFGNVDSKTQASDGNYIKHTSAGSKQSGGASWNVKWTAPSSEVQGPVTFYVAGNEANGDFENQGDYIYTTTRQIRSSIVTPSPAVSPTPTPAGCESESITLDSNRAKLKFGESKNVVAMVTGSNGCKSEGVTVNVKVKTGKKRVTVAPEIATTNVNGQATFTITANQQKGNAKVLFTVEDSKGDVHKDFIIVKIRKK